MSLTVRTATLADAAALCAIYGYYTEHTAISFEYTAPTVSEFEARIRWTLEAYPYLVAERDGKPVGYAYAGDFSPRPAYAHCCEVTIYVDKSEKRSGIGRMLYEALERELLARGIELCYACIGVPTAETGEDEYLTANSRDFHARMGYREVGYFRHSGKKFGKYYDMIYMEKSLI